VGGEDSAWGGQGTLFVRTPLHRRGQASTLNS
jgi:hypothetical protein